MRDLCFALLLCCAIGWGTGCFDNPGIDPAPRELNFPVALALSSRAMGPSSHLFVANSNFDLRYNAGSVQSFDLGALSSCLSACVGADPLKPVVDGQQCTLGLRDDAARPCPGLFTSEVFLGSYADGLSLSPDGARLYLPIRSGGYLSYVDVAADGTLACGPEQKCDTDHRSALSTLTTADGRALPSDPVDVYSGSFQADYGFPAGAARYVLMVHRQGAASLFIDPADGASPPRLVDVSTNLAADLVGVRRNPRTGVLWSASTTVSSIQLLSIGVADTSTLAGAALYNEGALAISGVDTGLALGYGDARDVVFDRRPGVDRTYVLTRTPEALISLEGGSLARGWIANVGTGASRLTVVEHAAVGRSLAYVSCFDDRSIYVIDADLGVLVSVLRGVSGPFEIAVDVDRRWLLVVDFRSSVVRVFDLGPMLDCLAGAGSASCTPVLRGMIGVPRPVENLR